MVKCQCRV